MANVCPSKLTCTAPIPLLRAPTARSALGSARMPAWNSAATEDTLDRAPDRSRSGSTLSSLPERRISGKTIKKYREKKT